jgi:hypothetical protein
MDWIAMFCIRLNRAISGNYALYEISVTKSRQAVLSNQYQKPQNIFGE